jgi:tripartite-type tricarboxylate transporter receptor subunit TctC
MPTIGETVPGYSAMVYYGMSAPKGTPPEIVAALNKAVNEALRDPKLAARLHDLGGTAQPMTPAEYGKLIAEETEKWGKVVKFAGVSVD